MRFPILLALALLLAGCSAPGTTGDGPPGPTGATGLPKPSFAAPVDLSGANGGPEPVVVVAEDGTVFVAAQDAAGGAPRVWVSTDGAKSFRLSRPSGAGGGEVDIAVGRGFTFVSQLSPSGNVVSYSNDKGQTWRQTAFAGTTYFERELVAIDPQGSAYLVARFGLGQLSAAQPGEEASVARSDDGGVTFLPVGTAWDSNREPGLGIGNFLAYGSTLGMAYNCRDARAVCFAKSTDRGATWSQHLVAQRNVNVDNVYPILAASGARLVVTWSDASDGRLAVWAASSTDGGASWSAPARVSAMDETATLPWVAMGGGRTWVVYLSTDVALTEAGAAAAQDAQWFATAVRVDDALAPQARGPVVPDVVHEGVISKPVGRPGEGGPFDRSFGDFFTVAVDREGRALVAVVKTTGGRSQDLFVAEAR